MIPDVCFEVETSIFVPTGLSPKTTGITGQPGVAKSGPEDVVERPPLGPVRGDAVRKECTTTSNDT